MISAKIAYHLEELEVAITPQSEHRNLPDTLPTDRAILDIGCGIGQTLVGMNLVQDGERLVVGVDIDEDSLAYGRENFDTVHFTCCTAEALSFADNTFDFVFSRVALPYTNIPLAIKEIARVVRPGGHIWISMHRQEMTWNQLYSSIRKGLYKDVFFRSYVLANGYFMHFFGRMLAFPYPSLLRCNSSIRRRKYESFQTEIGMRKLLLKNGFRDIEFTKNRHFVVTAKLPPRLQQLSGGVSAIFQRRSELTN